MIKTSTTKEIKSYYNEILAFNTSSDHEISTWFKKTKTNPMLAYSMGYYLSRISEKSDTLSLYNTRFIQELESLTCDEPFFTICKLTDTQITDYIIDTNNIMDLNLSKINICQTRRKTKLSFSTDKNETVETSYFWNSPLKDLLTYHTIKNNKLIDVCTTRCGTLMSILYATIEPALTHGFESCDEKKYMAGMNEIIYGYNPFCIGSSNIVDTWEQIGKTALAYMLVKENVPLKPLLLKYAAKKLKLDPVQLEHRSNILFPILEDKAKSLFDVVTQIVNSLRQENITHPIDDLNLKLTFD